MVATLVTFFVAWAILKDIGFATKIGLLDTVIKIGAYYGHERLWDRVPIGRAKEPEYYL